MFERFLMTLPAFVGQTLKFIFIVLVVGSMAFSVRTDAAPQKFRLPASPLRALPVGKTGHGVYQAAHPVLEGQGARHEPACEERLPQKDHGFRSSEYLEMLILETCVAEFVHFVLILISPMFLIMMEGTAGWICMALYAPGQPALYHDPAL